MSSNQYSPSDPSHVSADGLDASHAHPDRAQTHLNSHAPEAQRTDLPTLNTLLDTTPPGWLTPGEDWGHAQLEAIKQRSRQWRDQGQQARLSAEAYVKAKPFTALAWAAAVGAALVALPQWWRRR